MFQASRGLSAIAELLFIDQYAYTISLMMFIGDRNAG